MKITSVTRKIEVPVDLSIDNIAFTTTAKVALITSFDAETKKETFVSLNQLGIGEIYVGKDKDKRKYPWKYTEALFEAIKLEAQSIAAEEVVKLGLTNDGAKPLFNF